MYFDCVLDKDMKPLFNGSSEETVRWLKENETADTDWVCLGKGLERVSIPDYLEQAEAAKK